ncbi:MAG TPA: alpha/beta hydrolase [Aliidongia sp.]|nr:alpha/beta hydrolase [Aliidongia sp.]
MRMKSIIAAAAVALVAPMSAALADTTPAAGVKNIVIVPDAFVDGSGWRVVHDILIHKGYHVQVVQERFLTLDDDVSITNEIIRQQPGATLLVGHGYGGAVVSIAGARGKVKGLVYVDAVQPDVGEAVSQILASVPEPNTDIITNRDGRLFFNPAKFAADYAGDLTTNRTDFMAASQVPATTAAFGGLSLVAAWRTKPSYAVVATDDRFLSPDLQRSMYKRAGSKVTEIKASHAVYISQPEAVAAVIEEAALAAK